MRAWAIRMDDLARVLQASENSLLLKISSIDSFEKGIYFHSHTFIKDVSFIKRW